MALLSFVDSTPRAYRLKVSNAYLTISTSGGTSPGFSVVGAILASNKPYIARIPVIIFSAADDHDLTQKAMSVGATAALQKPFNPRDLSKLLHYVMKNQIGAAS